MVEVRFDDLDGLRGHISDEFGPGGPTAVVTQAMIDRFADLTDDHQWIHCDVEKAREGPYGTTVAHGFLTLALMPLLKAPIGIEIVGESSRVNYGAESFRMLSPVPVGSTLQSQMRLVGVREHTRGTLLVQENRIAVVGAERPALIYMGLLLYQS